MVQKMILFKCTMYSRQPFIVELLSYHLLKWQLNSDSIQSDEFCRRKEKNQNKNESRIVNCSLNEVGDDAFIKCF